MQILRPGNVKKLHPRYRGVCFRCDCAVICEASEVTSFNDPRNESYSYVECPTMGCGNQIFLTKIDESA